MSRLSDLASLRCQKANSCLSAACHESAAPEGGGRNVGLAGAPNEARDAQVFRKRSGNGVMGVAAVLSASVSFSLAESCTAESSGVSTARG